MVEGGYHVWGATDVWSVSLTQHRANIATLIGLGRHECLRQREVSEPSCRFMYTVWATPGPSGGPGGPKIVGEAVSFVAVLTAISIARSTEVASLRLGARKC